MLVFYLCVRTCSTLIKHSSLWFIYLFWRGCLIFERSSNNVSDLYCGCVISEMGSAGACKNRKIAG